MSQENVALLKSLYEAFGRGDVPTVLAAMDPGIVWNEAENFPYADKNPYVGPAAIVEGVFARLVGEWDGFSVALEELLDAGDTEKTGIRIHSQFAHVWRLRGGKIVKFQQYTDTAQAAKAVGG